MNATVDLYVSSGAFQTTDIDTIIRQCLDYGIKGLELSSGGVHLSQKALTYLEQLVADKKIALLVHNYFPAPQTPFVLNLAAADDEVLTRSREHCRQAISLCGQLNSPFYSVHAGFCYHAVPHKLGGKQTDLPRIAKNDANRIFTESIALLADYAAANNIDILIENNALIRDNLVDAKNELMLGATSTDFVNWMKNFAGLNVFALLDVAHLHVSAKSLGLDEAQEFRTIAPYTRAVHLSDNDAIRDNNQKISHNSWFWPQIKHIKSAKYILEVYNLTPEEIKGQLDIASSFLRTMSK